jgi:hypothetical protein
LIQLLIGAVRAWHVVKRRSIAAQVLDVIAGNLNALSVFANTGRGLRHGNGTQANGEE